MSQEQSSPPAGALRDERSALLQAYQRVRLRTEALAAPLSAEDCAIQSMPDVSPCKWHLAHTTWFFETFLLKAFAPNYREVDPHYEFLFNSYYLQVGRMHPREQRGLLSRPTLAEVLSYRAQVDERMHKLLEDVGSATYSQVQALIELGLHHEQQHQELLLMDIKHVFSCNPLKPAYRATSPLATRQAPALRMQLHTASLTEIGHAGTGFCYDNELPRHKVYVHEFSIANRCVTSGEFAAFIADGGYRRSELWLSDGWATAQAEGWTAPLYWEQDGEAWLEFRLAGLQPIDPNSPVVHLCYYEADAYARWAGCRLPTEAEWEVAARQVPVAGNFQDSELFHPRPATLGNQQFFGDVWEFTSSAYAPYPGYRADDGAIGEYNGKFMSGQMVLRGGSCATPKDHIRVSYRNFFHPAKRWGFQGLRLASD